MGHPKEKAARGDKTEAAHKTTIGFHRTTIIPIGQRRAANCEWCDTHLPPDARRLCADRISGSEAVAHTAAAMAALQNRRRSRNGGT